MDGNLNQTLGIYSTQEMTVIDTVLRIARTRRIISLAEEFCPPEGIYKDRRHRLLVMYAMVTGIGKHDSTIFKHLVVNQWPSDFFFLFFFLVILDIARINLQSYSSSNCCT